MIRFPCPECSAGLRVDDSRAGQLTRCPACGARVRAPRAAGPEGVPVVDELPVVEDDDEEPMDVEAAEDEGRPRKKRRRRPPPPEEEPTEDRDFMTRNRVMGGAGVVLGIFFTTSALGYGLLGRIDLRNPLNSWWNGLGCSSLSLGVLLIVAGLFYAIRG